MSCSKMAVHQEIASFQNFSHYHEKKRSERPRKTSPHVDNLIRQMAVQSPTSFCKKIRAHCLLKAQVFIVQLLIGVLFIYSFHFNLKVFKTAKNLAKPQL